MSLIRNPDRGQLTSPVQLGEVVRISAVSLDPLTGLTRNQRWRDYDASVPCRTQLPLNAVAARSRLVAEPQLVPAACQLRSQPPQSSRRVCDLAIFAYFTSLARLG